MKKFKAPFYNQCNDTYVMEILSALYMQINPIIKLNISMQDIVEKFEGNTKDPSRHNIK